MLTPQSTDALLCLGDTGVEKKIWAAQGALGQTSKKEALRKPKRATLPDTLVSIEVIEFQ